MIIANPGNAFAQGHAFAGQIKEQRRQNSLAELFKTQGPQIAAGDPAALNAFAQLDPMAARGIRRENAADSRAAQSFDMNRQSHNQSMEVGEAQLASIRQRTKIQAEEHAAKMTAAEAAAARSQVDSIISGATAAYRQGPGAFQAYSARIAAQAQQAGIDPAQITYDNFPSIAAGLVGLRDGLGAGIKAADGFSPDTQKPLSAPGKLAADLKAGRITEEQYNAANEKTGMRVSSDGNGGFIFEQGVGVTDSAAPKMTVDAAKNTGFLVRTRDANDTLSEIGSDGRPLDEQGLGLGQQVLGSLPGGVGNLAQSEDYQQFEQAKRDFVNALLRRESGAAIGKDEFDSADKQYFPIPGDGPKVIEQKRRNRINAIRGLELGSGPGAAFVDKQDGDAKPSVDGFVQFKSVLGDKYPDPQALWDAMTPEERKVFEE